MKSIKLFMKANPGNQVKAGQEAPVTAETAILANFLIMAGCLWAFVKLAYKIQQEHTDNIDNRLLRACRRQTNLAIPVGPAWLSNAASEVTALGSGTILFLYSTILVGFLCLNRRFRAAGFVIAALASGLLLCYLLKDLFVRRRPTAVPQLTHFDSKSFPSGHSMGSALVYLTLGSIIAKQAKGWIPKVYFLSVGLLLAMLVGVSRVFLGVHYPSDVLAGWAAGSLWSIACAEMARWLQDRGAVEPSGSVALSAADKQDLGLLSS